jgi:hypothetical protein
MRMHDQPGPEDLERFAEAEIERLEGELVRWRILLENLRDYKEDVPNAALAARVYRSLLEHEPPAVEVAEEKRAQLHRWAEQGNEYAEEVLELLSDDPWWGSRPEDV